MTRKTDDLDRHIGLRLKMRRILRNFSQDELAQNLGITFQQIQKYERAMNRISAARLYEIAKILSVPLTYFYEGYEEENEKYLVAENVDTVQDYINSLPKKRHYTENDVLARIMNMPAGQEKKNIFRFLEKELQVL